MMTEFLFIIELTLHIHSYNTESTNEAEFVARPLQVKVEKKEAYFFLWFVLLMLCFGLGIRL